MATKKSGYWKDPKGSSKSSSKPAPKKGKSGSSFAKSIAAPLKFAADPFAMVGGTKAVVKGAMKAADWITPDFGSSKRAANLRKTYGSKAPAPRPKPSGRTYGPPAPKPGPKPMPKRPGGNMAAPIPMPKRPGVKPTPREMPKRVPGKIQKPYKARTKPPTRTTKPAYKSSASKRQKGMQK